MWNYRGAYFLQIPLYAEMYHCQKGASKLLNTDIVLFTSLHVSASLDSHFTILIPNLFSSACVNSVRWSNNGKYLASGGDDKIVMIWQAGR